MENWFEHWFNTSYYHILYRNRDDNEAAKFIDLIVQYLRIQPPARILDVACGKGRHSIYLNKLGFHVVGIDIAKNNIKSAQLTVEEEKLSEISFHSKDMREPFGLGRFDLVFNLFTSFGYFENHADDLKAIQQVADSLLPGAKFVLDFFNTPKVLAHLKDRDQLNIEGVCFTISRKVENGFIVKTIEVEDSNQFHTFYEKVKAIDHHTFIRYFTHCGLVCNEVFGSYQLDPYHADSDRMVFVVEKPIFHK